MSVNVNVKSVGAAEHRTRQRLPKGWSDEKSVAFGIGDGHVVYGSDVRRLSQVIDRGDEATGAWIQSVLG